MATDERMPPVPAQAWTTEQAAAAAEFKAGRGYEVSGPFAVMLRSPEVMLRAKAMGDYLRYRNVLPKRVSEMVILLIARQWTQQYEWFAHHQVAMHAGLQPEIAAAIAEGRRPDGLAEDEDAVYAFCTELHRNGAVSDPTYARVTALFGEQGAIDLCAICGHYSTLAMVLNVARTPLPEGASAPLKPSKSFAPTRRRSSATRRAASSTC